MLASIATQNSGTAQLLFLVAAIIAAICVVFGFAPFGRPYPWAIGALIMVVLFFVSLGLLFAF
jgi:hypothetical protein